MARERKPGHVRFGAVVRDFRERSSYSGSGVALSRTLNRSRGWLSGLELGGFKCFFEDAVKLDGLLNANGEIIRAWNRFVSESSFPVFYGQYPELEGTAESVSSYEWRLVPGLLQTDAYASVILGGDQRKLASRKARQSILFRPNPPLLHAVIDESVLNREIGSPAVMEEQCGFLLDMSHRPRVILQVSRCGWYPGAKVSFAIATQADRSEMLFEEELIGGSTYVDEARINQAHGVFATLHSEALNVADSRAFVEERRKLWIP